MRCAICEQCETSDSFRVLVKYMPVKYLHTAWFCGFIPFSEGINVLHTCSRYHTTTNAREKEYQKLSHCKSIHFTLAKHDKYFIHVESHSRTREEMCWHCLISMRSFMLHANRVHFVQPAAIICTVLAFCCCYMLVIKIALSANENNRNRNNMTQNAYTHIDSNHSLSLSLSRGHISLENRNLSGKKIKKTTKMLWFIMPV